MEGKTSGYGQVVKKDGHWDTSKTKWSTLNIENEIFANQILTPFPLPNGSIMFFFFKCPKFPVRPSTSKVR